MQILLRHLHGRYHIYSGLRGHCEPFAVDQVRMLKTSGAKTNRLLASFSGTGMNSDGHAELVSGRGKRLHLVIEPRYARRIIARAEIAASVCGLDPVATESVLAADQRSHRCRVIGNAWKRAVSSEGCRSCANRHDPHSR